MSLPIVDTFGRKHTYLRISLTDKCNLRCTYCMPQEDMQFMPSKWLMQADEIKTLSEIFVEMGVDVYRWNQPNSKTKYILTSDSEGDCIPHLIFLNELGIKNKLLSYNPSIFKKTIDDLCLRINYLESNGLNSEDIREICIRIPNST